MKILPVISIIVPVYNVEPYLVRCIDSILAQTFADFELILIDDGSPDNCGKICDEYAKKEARIHVIHQKNGGLSSARNAGIDWVFKNSNSQWLTFIDSDDWIHPQYLDLLLSSATTLNADVSICEYEETNEYFHPAPVTNFDIHKQTPEEFFVNHHVTAVIACCKLYNKSCFENIRYPLGKLHEDEFTTYKILFQKTHVSYLNKKLYFYYTNPHSIVRSKWSPKRLDAITAYEEQITFFRKSEHRDALVDVERKLLWYIVAQIEFTEKYDAYKSFTPRLKKKLKSCIKDFKKDLNLSLENGFDFYRKAYPTSTKFYWIIISVLKKLKIIRR